MRRAAAVAVGGLLCVVALLSARMLLGARAELRAAGAAPAGDWQARVRHLRRAMVYYLPGNPFVRRAEQALHDEADRAEASNEPARALEILHEHRSAILALRGSTRPFWSSLPEINRRIAMLSAGRADAAAALRSPAGAEALRRRLDRPPEPNLLLSTLGLLGFLVYAGGGLLLFYCGLRPDATRAPRFFPLLGVVLVGLVLFGVGMALA